jgi:phospholipid/cholesterol/gamma-HCH transport system ATP-binding protein
LLRAGLVKRFGAARLDGVDLDVHAGATVELLGRSGSGKSVLLKHAIGLLRADGGTLEVLGADVTRADAATGDRVRRDVAMVFQGAALFDSMSVGENIALGLEHQRRVARDGIAVEVERCLSVVGLAGTPAPALVASGGMRKRVRIARRSRSSGFSYDEPTSGLDPVTSDVINRLIRRLQRELGASAIVVTHDLASARFVGDRITMLHEGKLVFDGTVAEVDRATDPVVRRFVEGRSDEPVGEAAPAGGS